MRSLFLTGMLVATGCSGSKSATATPPSDTCGNIGDACSPDGRSCSPIPIGTGWAHALMCEGGKWQDLEIAPLPQPQATKLGPVEARDAGAP